MFWKPDSFIHHGFRIYRRFFYSLSRNFALYILSRDSFRLFIQLLSCLLALFLYLLFLTFILSLLSFVSHYVSPFYVLNTLKIPRPLTMNISYHNTENYPGRRHTGTSIRTHAGVSSKSSYERTILIGSRKSEECLSTRCRLFLQARSLITCKNQALFG